MAGYLNKLETDVNRLFARAELGEIVDTSEIDQRIQQAFEKATESDVSKLAALLDKVASISPRVSEEVIKETFFNVMATLALSKPELRSGFNDLQGHACLATYTLLEVIEKSGKIETIKLIRDVELSEINCPENYRELSKAIFGFKKIAKELSKEQFSKIKELILHPEFQGDLRPLANRMFLVGKEISQRPLFQELIKNVENFCNSGVTEDVIYNTFYQLMAEQTLILGIIPKEDLQSQEPYIYTALSSHTILEAMVRSRDLKNGVWLIENRVVTLENCPDKYKELAKLLLILKDRINVLSAEQVKMIKYSSVEDIEIPDDLLKLKTPELMSIATTINSAATTISQFKTFQEIIDKVIKFCS